MIKRLSLLLTMAGFLFSLVACSGGSPTTSEGSKEDGTAKKESKQLVVVDWGGTSSKAAQKAVYEPFEKKYGVNVVVVSPTDTGKLLAMVESGNVEWDIVNHDTDVALRLESQGLLEPLDYSIIKKDDVYPHLVTDYTIGLQLYFTNIAYNTELFSGDHPKTWAEFWDTKKYPGSRSLYKNPMGTLESALLADGVKKEELYPLDVDRALKSLDKIKGDIKTWWDAGAQPPQLLATKEAAVAAAWNGRVSTAKAEGSKVENEFGEALMMSTSWIIPKGAPNKDLAQEFIAFAMEAEQQAAYSNLIDYAPTNMKALDLLSEEVKERLGQTEEKLSNQVVIDVKYWADHFEEINKKFNEWLLK
ncbi:ABC transporter substrate-binding protein [Schinkia azotoformans]|uniref:ABC transporter substrate-binding protein n=1 Tax=Schinkia azotoformans TaxID=1454 RepID=UPI002DBFEC2B|nr:ABC transporter substrate-binding protein [Schinkia azotoformans]MEC1747814.1 ABC transporter substrate-binding protein [Schinkia azotoformans]MEC1760458.1 ABC transporter substrate-binding protein [Schinkia azotoformans]MEC1771574.1 ABC transporter substrate-binding protein [Schinkia azotoformans]MED4368804.1 ABC transporter substrate-binding protein [Schinkia azotoformans]MED4378391.1 ABC transporter substrate-binding protein [Schinkia azotoformans]